MPSEAIKPKKHPPNSLQRLEDVLSSKKRQFLFHNREECPLTLEEFFIKHLSHLDANSFKSRLSLGGFYINGLETVEDKQLHPPCKIEYYEPKFCINEISKFYPAFNKDWIIYEDEFLSLVYKPKNLPCLPTKEQKIYNLKKYIEEHYSKKIHMPSRLDTSTDGLLILSLNKKTHNYLQQAFERRLVCKRYLLASHNDPGWRLKFVSANITKDHSHPVLRKVPHDNSGKRCLTIFSACGSEEGNSVFMARPLSGRTHQIRVHAAHIGIPIKGDNFYGGISSGNLHLISYYLGFWHPFKRQFLEFTLPHQFLPSWALPYVDL